MKAKVLLGITVYMAFMYSFTVLYIGTTADEYVFACMHFNIHFKGLSENNQNM